MIKLFRYKKMISQLLIFLYLLIGAGMGNALLLCEEADAYSHLTYTLGGQCLTECPALLESVDGGGPRLVVLSAASCLDTPLTFSHVPLPRSEKLQIDALSLGWDAFNLTSVTPPAVDLFKRVQGTPLPPFQALNALRSVVLLH